MLFRKDLHGKRHDRSHELRICMLTTEAQNTYLICPSMFAADAPWTGDGAVRGKVGGGRVTLTSNMAA